MLPSAALFPRPMEIGRRGFRLRRAPSSQLGCSCHALFLIDNGNLNSEKLGNAKIWAKITIMLFLSINGMQIACWTEDQEKAPRSLMDSMTWTERSLQHVYRTGRACRGSCRASPTNRMLPHPVSVKRRSRRQFLCGFFQSRDIGIGSTVETLQHLLQLSILQPQFAGQLIP